MSFAPTFPGALQRALSVSYERHGRQLPGVLSAVLAILLGSTLAELAWNLVPPPGSAAWQPAPVQAGPARPDGGGVDVGRIVDAHLFGRYEAPKVTTQTVAEAPETALNLTLVGLLADEDEAWSRALIAVQNSEEQGFAVGDDVTRGVVLQAIFPDRVILSRNGRLETLSLDRDKPGSGTAVSQAVPEPEDSDAGAGESLAAIRQDVLQDPGKASQYIRVQPANVGGRLKGYRIYPGRQRKAFSDAGLRPGDLVTEVNGVQLDDPAKALQLLSDLSSAGQINLVIERGGQPENISLNFN